MLLTKACSEIREMRDLLSIEEAEYLIALSACLKEKKRRKDEEEKIFYEQEKIRILSKISSVLNKDSYRGVELTNLLNQFCKEEGFQLYPKFEEIDYAYEPLSGEPIYKKFIFRNGIEGSCQIRVSVEAKRISTAILHVKIYHDTGLDDL